MKLTPCTEETKHYAFESSLRCGAKTRSGSPCRSPAIRHKKRCRMHGGKGSGAPKGSQNALKHGHTTHDAKVRLSKIRELIRQSRNFMASLED